MPVCFLEAGYVPHRFLPQAARNGQEDETTGRDDAVLRQAAHHPLA
jgi:hypothetical protein